MSEDQPPAPAPALVRLLIVEDDDEAADLLREFLRSAGARVDTTVCRTLADGVRVGSSGSFDAALLDLRLPDGDGIETFRRLRDAVPDLPIVIVTGTSNETVARATLREGAKDFITKATLSGPVLLRSLRYVIERTGGDGERAAHLRDLQRSLLDRLAASGTGGVAGRFLGSRPLRELSSEVFEAIVHAFALVVDLQVDHLVFGLKQDSPERLRSMAADLADALAGPRDVVDVYDAVITRKEQDVRVSDETMAAYEDLARPAAFELMGIPGVGVSRTRRSATDQGLMDGWPNTC